MQGPVPAVIAAIMLAVMTGVFGRKRRLARPLMLLILSLQGAAALSSWRAAAMAADLTGQTLTVTGRVLSARKYEHGVRLHLTDTVTAMPSGARRTGDVIVYGGAITAAPFERVCVQGTVAPFSTATNDGNYDERKHRHARGIYLKLRSGVLLKRSPPEGMFRPMAACTRYAGEVFERIGRAEGAAVFNGLFTGRMDEEADGIRADFAATGIVHILVISGFHLMFLAECLQRLAVKCRVPKSPALLLCIVLLGLYVLFTGFGLSAQRAFCMYILRAGAFWLRRSYDTRSAVAAVALLHLTARPAILYDRSFLLSFGFVLIVTTVHDRTAHLPMLRRIIAFAFGVWFLSLPLLSGLFYEVPGYGMWMNIAALPLTGLMLLFMAAGLLSGLFIPPVGDFFLMAGDAVLQAVQGLAALNLKLPFAVWGTGAVSPWRIVVFYLVAAWWQGGLARGIDRWFRHLETVGRRPGRRRAARRRILKPRSMTGRRRFGRVLIPIAAIGLLFMPRPAVPQIHILDVGQGDGIVITSRSANILIDGGSTNVASVGERRILPFMKYHRIRQFDYAFLSHVHKDHYSGLLELMAAGRIGTLVITDYGAPTADFLSITATARQYGVPIRKILRGDTCRFGDMTFECLHPPAGYRGANPNSYSMVLRWTYGRMAVMFTGDLEAPEETLILRGTAQQPVDVLKVGHHGSATSTTPAWLRSLKPSAAVISCGRENRFGHPDAAVTERLAAAGIVTGRTDTDGQWSILPMRDGWQLRNYGGATWKYCNEP